MVRVAVTLQHVPSGYTWSHDYEVEEEYAEYQEFLWEEGNYSCDCNREIFLVTDHGYPSPIEQVACGEDDFALLSIIKSRHSTAERNQRSPAP